VEKNRPSLKRRVQWWPGARTKEVPDAAPRHPLFNHRGVPSWPPTWTWVDGLDNNHPIGEIGTLREVYPSKIEPVDRCFLYIDFGGASYLGCLFIDDTAFCRQIVELLLANRNHPIAEIGSLDLLHTL